LSNTGSWVHWLLGHFELVTSSEIVDELIAVFGKPYFRARMTDQQAAENIALLRRRATVVSSSVQLTRPRHASRRRRRHLPGDLRAG
jgi:predicted nucleic acid-binding protein